MNNKQVNKVLLFQYFEGRATLLEVSEIERWLEDEKNSEFFFEALESWEKSNQQYLPNVETGYGLLQTKIHTLDRLRNQDSEKPNPFWIRRRGWLMIACIIALLIAGFLNKDMLLYKTVTTSYGETCSVVLSDQSKITLNANSQIKYPRFMLWNKDREVWVTGEAFFNVKRKIDHQRFIVHTRHLDIVVMGTSFNVNDRNLTTKVVLEEGKVRVVSADDGHTTLAVLENSGDFVESDGKKSEVVTGKVDYSFFTSWQQRKLKFDNATVAQVLKSIDEFYGVTIKCSDTTILSRNFSGTLPNDNLDIVLRSLTNIYSTKFTPEKTLK